MVKDFQVNIPGDRYQEAFKNQELLGNILINKFTFFDQIQPTTRDPFQALLNRNWKAQLSITGSDGLPPTEIAGNVLRPETTFKLSIRLPPTKNPKEAVDSLTKLLTTNVPYNAKVILGPIISGSGFNAPTNQPYLNEIINEASLSYYQKEAIGFGDGGSIPLMNTLQAKYPQAQFVIIGVVGPNTNAHGPNEYLHIPFTKKLICSVSQILAQVQPFLRK